MDAGATDVSAGSYNTIFIRILYWSSLKSFSLLKTDFLAKFSSLTGSKFYTMLYGLAGLAFSLTHSNKMSTINTVTSTHKCIAQAKRVYTSTLKYSGGG